MRTALEASACQPRVNHHHHVSHDFARMAVIWGLLSLCLAVWLNLIWLWPSLGPEVSWLSYGRLAPLQHHLLLYGLGGSAVIAGGYSIAMHSVLQRESRTDAETAIPDIALPPFTLKLMHSTFLGWQAVVALGALAIVAGYSSGQYMAEAPWLVDLLMTLVWLAVAWVFFTVLEQRTLRRLPVACWYFIAGLMLVLMQHVLISLSVPIGLLESIPLFTGSLEALIQRWQAGPLPGGMFAFGLIALLHHMVMSRSRRPLHSHRLATTSFWMLVLLVTWGGAPLLFASALPAWSQTLGMAMGLLLLAPGLALSLNGLMTLKEDWHSLRRDPLICLLAAALVSFALAVLEYSLLSLPTLNALAFSATNSLSPAASLGVVATVAIVMAYHLLPPMRSLALLKTHALLAIIGTLLCIAASWATTLLQGSMWHVLADDGRPLYTLSEVLEAARMPMMISLGGLACWALGMLLMLLNVMRTLAVHKSERQAAHERQLPKSGSRKTSSQPAIHPASPSATPPATSSGGHYA